MSLSYLYMQIARKKDLREKHKYAFLVSKTGREAGQKGQPKAALEKELQKRTRVEEESSADESKNSTLSSGDDLD